MGGVKGSFSERFSRGWPQAVFSKANPYALLEIVPSSQNCLGDL